MGLFNQHTKSPQEATTNAGAHTSVCTAKGSDAENLRPSTYAPAETLTNKDGADRFQNQLPESSNAALITSGAPVSDRLVHGKVTEQKQKHHFWRKHNKDHAKVPAVQGDKQVPTASGRHRFWAAWPEPGDPLGEGNLGQGLTWR